MEAEPTLSVDVRGLPEVKELVERMAIWIRAAAAHVHADHAALHRPDPIDECGHSFCVSSRAALKGEEAIWAASPPSGNAS